MLFFRHIDGQDYNGVVKAKEQAQQQYTHAVSRGQSAGLVRYNDQWIHFLPVFLFLLYFVEDVSFRISENKKKSIAQNYV